MQTSIFADDTMFHMAHSNRNYDIICQLHRKMNQIVIWIDKWRLKLNINKTKANIFRERQTKHLRRIKNQLINGLKIHQLEKQIKISQRYGGHTT